MLSETKVKVFENSQDLPGVGVGVRKRHVSLNSVIQHCGENIAQVTSLFTKLALREDTGRAHNESSLCADSTNHFVESTFPLTSRFPKLDVV